MTTAQFVALLIKTRAMQKSYNPRGRNAASGYATIVARCRALHEEILSNDDVCEMLDTHPNLAERYSEAERWHTL